MTDQGATLWRPFRRDPREPSRKIGSSPTARATTPPSSASNFDRSPGWRPWSEAPRRRERERAAKAGWLETVRELRNRSISWNGPRQIHDARPSVLPPSRPLHWPRPGWRSSSTVLSTKQKGSLLLWTSQTRPVLECQAQPCQKRRRTCRHRLPSLPFPIRRTHSRRRHQRATGLAWCGAPRARR